jgi:nitrate reductase assembly molybdenum cofactor insertion protein NarJ
MNLQSRLRDPACIALVRQAAEWRLLGLLLERPRPEWRNQVEALAAEVAAPELRSAAARALAEASEGLYHTIFGPGGPASAREVRTCGLLQPGPLLAELAATYEAFAYRPALDEPLDHVAVEAGFVAYLRFKEAYARVCGDVEHAEVTAEAARGFIEEHLASLAEPLAGTLASSGIEYLTQASAELLQRVGPRRKRLAVEEPVELDDEQGCCPGAEEPELLWPC